jgi:exonuclease III
MTTPEPSTSNTSKPRFSNRFARAMHTIGNVLVAPAQWGFKQVMKATDPIKPGRHEAMGQFTPWVEGLLVKPLRLAFGLGAFALGLPFSVVGQLVFKIPAALLGKEKFEYFHQQPTTGLLDSDSYEAPSEQLTEVKIKSWNLAAMHSMTRRLNGTRPVENRVQEAADYLLTQDDDIICLQEVFTEEATEILVNKLKGKYPHIVHNVGKNVVGMNSGLMLLSKYPLEKVEFETFESRVGLNKLSQKGVLGAIVMLPGNKKMVVTNAHLDAGGKTGLGANGNKSKDKQLNQIMTMRNRLESAIDPGAEYISCFAADANLTAKKLETLEKKDDLPTIKLFINDYQYSTEKTYMTCLKHRNLNEDEYQNATLQNSKAGGDILVVRPKDEKHQNILEGTANLTIGTHQETKDMSDHYPCTLKFTPK